MDGDVFHRGHASCLASMTCIGSQPSTSLRFLLSKSKPQQHYASSLPDAFNLGLCSKISLFKTTGVCTGCRLQKQSYASSLLLPAVPVRRAIPVLGRCVEQWRPGGSERSGGSWRKAPRVSGGFAGLEVQASWGPARFPAIAWSGAQVNRCSG